MESARQTLIRLSIVFITLSLFVSVILLAAPYIGLGEDEAFILYKKFGYSRGEVFGISLGLAALAAYVLVVTVGISGAYEWFRRQRGGGGQLRRGLGEILRQALRDAFRAIIAVLFVKEMVIYGAILGASGLVSFIAFELWVRHELTTLYRTEPHTMIWRTETLNHNEVLRDAPDSKIGHFKENRTITTLIVGANNIVAVDTTYRTNNVGFLSDRDYSLDPQKGEYRIVVLGDSMTGTTSMPFQWIDLVEDALNADRQHLEKIGYKTARVFNLGVPGSGFSNFSDFYEKYAKRFAPNMVIVNFIETDYPRIREPQGVGGKKVVGGFVEIPLGTGVDGWVMLNLVCTEGPIKLSNGNCYHFFNFIGSSTEIIRNADLRFSAKNFTIEEYIRGKTDLSFFSYGLQRLLGNDMQFNQYRRPEIFHFEAISERRMIEEAKKHLSLIMADHPNVVVTVMPLFWDYFPNGSYPANYERTRRLMDSVPSLDAVFMHERMPYRVGQTGLENFKAEIKSWYNLPWDGHMSGKGGRLYARAFTALIKEKMLLESSRIKTRSR